MTQSQAEWRNTCICPDPWCPVHAKDADGHKLQIDDEDSLAWCDECKMDRMPVGGCSGTVK